VSAAVACANIALVKYWGKGDPAENTPAAGSLSLTLAALTTRTSVTLAPGAEADALVLDGVEEQGKARARVSRFLDLVRAAAGRAERAHVVSHNDFPTAAGLASSASAFAALAVAASAAYGLDLSPRALSILARRGSGSAARSIFGGFARMHAGRPGHPEEAFAEPLAGVSLRLSAAVCVAAAKAKKVGSTDGMEHTRLTSPYHAAWLDTVQRDLGTAEAALRAGDLEALALVVEGNCLAMHADAMAARPGVIYLGPSTLWAIERVRALRAAGTPVFFTIDAGPHLVAFTPPEHLARVADALREHDAVANVLTSESGEGARLVGG
jgi:diphosphomevalonate decarboxylase